jgi:transglutaminase-like putative cysteine protease
VIYDIRHVTTYRYEAPVTAAYCTMRLTPPSSAEQQVLWSEIKVTPAFASRTENAEFFGARAVTVTIEAAHRELRIEATSRVGVNRRVGAEPETSPSWEQVCAQSLAMQSLAAAAPAHYLFPTPLIGLSPAVTSYAKASFPAGRAVVAGAADLMHRIRRDFAYDKHATELTTTVEDAFQRRRGVCQDFANVMIAGLRGIGLPTAYVSGYIHTVPPPGMARLQGADATHAWVSVWCGEELGWVGFDPTNSILVEDEHVLLVVGRDYADISPVHGISLGSGDHSLKVEVDVIPVGD